MIAATSTFRFHVRVPREVSISPQESLDRDNFYAWAWDALIQYGLEGVHEGTLLTEEAHEQGLETESWTIDSGEAPRERDWVAAQVFVDTAFYFSTREGAEEAAQVLSQLGLEVGGVEEQKPQDWDAEWKASFAGARVRPFWSVLPPWVRPDEKSFAQGGVDSPVQEVLLRVNPGAGFGTGTHETTQLCLEALGQVALEKVSQTVTLSQAFDGMRVLDFGSGSGILAIAVALLGAQVDAVEIDPLAIDNAIENAGLNQVVGRVSYSRELQKTAVRYPIIIANILKPVLLQFSTDLVERLASDGILVLSGLMEKDAAEVSAHYSSLLKGAQAQVMESGEWRALVFKLAGE